MKILLTIWCLATVYHASAQSDNQTDLVEVLNVALQTDKLPNELINKGIPCFFTGANSPFIIVKSDKDKNLSRLPSPLDNNHVWIVDYEDIFLCAISHGLVVLNIKRKKNRLTLDFKTVKYPSKETNTTCHTGRIVGEKVNGTWTIASSESTAITCAIDMMRPKK